MAALNYRKWDTFEDESDDEASASASASAPGRGAADGGEDAMTRALNETRAGSRTLPKLRGAAARGPVVRKTPEAGGAMPKGVDRRQRHVVEVVCDPN